MRKDFVVPFKAREKEDGDGGTLVAYAATFDRDPDSYGDVIARGAFKDTLEKWAASDARIPLLFGHRTDDPEMNLGAVIHAEEDERGLRIEASFDPDNQKAQYARKLVREGRLSKMSFAFDVIEEGTITLEDGREANELRKVDLFEVSLVPIPANSHADVIDVKALRPEVDDVDSKLPADDTADDSSDADTVTVTTEDGPSGDAGDDAPDAGGDSVDDVDVSALADAVRALAESVEGIGRALIDSLSELHEKVDALVAVDGEANDDAEKASDDADTMDAGADATDDADAADAENHDDDEAGDDADADAEVDDVDKATEKARAGELMSRMIRYFD